MTFPYKIIDLTHPLSPTIPTWDGSCGFEHHLQHDYQPSSTTSFRTHRVHMNEGIGTHIDAPAHCIPGGKTIDELNLNDLLAPCLVIDVSAKAHERYSVTVADIEVFEEKYGLIKPGSFIIVRTGWEKFWSEPEKYRGNLVYPCVSVDAAQFLLKRDIAGLGIDTLSPDRPDEGFPVHTTLLSAGKYIVENIANSANLPPVGFYSLALPIKIQGGTEAPVRLIAIGE